MPTRHNLTDVQQKTQTTIQDVRNWNKNDSALLTECWTICTEHMFCIVATNTPHITLILNIWLTGALVSFLLWLSRAKVGASIDDDRVGTFHSIRVQILRYQSLLPHHIRQCCCFCTSMGVRVGSGKNSQGREKKCNWRRTKRAVCKYIVWDIAACLQSCRQRLPSSPSDQASSISSTTKVQILNPKV